MGNYVTTTKLLLWPCNIFQEFLMMEEKIMGGTGREREEGKENIKLHRMSFGESQNFVFSLHSSILLKLG